VRTYDWIKTRGRSCGDSRESRIANAVSARLEVGEPVKFVLGIRSAGQTDAIDNSYDQASDCSQPGADQHQPQSHKQSPKNESDPVSLRE
jgi:hypothetical protein